MGGGGLLLTVARRSHFARVPIARVPLVGTCAPDCVVSLRGAQPQGDVEPTCYFSLEEEGRTASPRGGAKKADTAVGTAHNK